MQLCQEATFIASTAFFLPNVNASLLRGVDGEFAIGDILEVTEDRPGTFVRVSESDTVLLFDRDRDCCWFITQHAGVVRSRRLPLFFVFPSLLSHSSSNLRHPLSLFS